MLDKIKKFNNVCYLNIKNRALAVKIGDYIISKGEANWGQSQDTNTALGGFDDDRLYSLYIFSGYMTFFKQEAGCTDEKYRGEAMEFAFNKYRCMIVDLYKQKNELYGIF